MLQIFSCKKNKLRWNVTKNNDKIFGKKNQKLIIDFG